MHGHSAWAEEAKFLLVYLTSGEIEASMILIEPSGFLEIGRVQSQETKYDNWNGICCLRARSLKGKVIRYFLNTHCSRIVSKTFIIPFPNLPSESWCRFHGVARLSADETHMTEYDPKKGGHYNLRNRHTL